MLPKSWMKLRDDKRTLCQMILKKVALPVAVGVDGKSYWEAMILGITNNKFCSLRANLKQELFEQFQGKFYSTKTSKWFSDTNEIMIYVFHIIQMTMKMDGFPQVIAVERFMSMQGDRQVILKIQNLHMTKQNTSCGSLTSMLVMLWVIITFCNGVN